MKAFTIAVFIISVYVATNIVAYKNNTHKYKPKFQVGDCIKEVQDELEEEWVEKEEDVGYKIERIGKSHYQVSYQAPPESVYSLLNGKMVEDAPSYTEFSYIDENYIKTECL